MALFYPGTNTILDLYAAEPSAFAESKTFDYHPQPLPIASAQLDPKELITAESYLVIDVNSFTPIIEKNARNRMLPASTVKLATALVSYRSYRLEDIVTIRTTIPEELRMGLVSGERISVINLLYGTLVNSANDAAYALAEHYSGGVKSFVAQMNGLARQYRMSDTHFTNPVGFDNPRQYTTAYDLALLAREFIKSPFLINITSTKSITVSDAEFERFHFLSSNNELLGSIPHLGGLKTGYTENAGQNLISFYKLNNKPIIIVVLKSLDRFEDTKTIINYLQNNLVYQDIDKSL